MLFIWHANDLVVFAVCKWLHTRLTKPIWPIIHKTQPLQKHVEFNFIEKFNATSNKMFSLDIISIISVSIKSFSPSKASQLNNAKR